MFSIILSILVTLLSYMLLVLVVLWCWYQWTHREFLKAAAKIPCSIPALPLIGHALHTTNLEASTRLMLKLAEEGQRQGLHTTCFWAGPLPIILIFGMEDVQKILTSSNTVEKGSEYVPFTAFTPGQRSSILTASNEEWKTIRRHLNPMFHQRNLEQLLPVFNANSRELVSDLEQHVGKGPVEMFELAFNTALQSISNLTFGTGNHFDKETAMFKGVRHAIDRMPELVAKAIPQVWLRFRWIFELIYKKDIKEVQDYLNNYISYNVEVFHKGRQQSKVDEQQHQSEDTDSGFESNNEGFLHLIKAFDGLRKVNPTYDDDQFYAEAIALIGTGTDTIGLSVASCFLALAQYQDIQERLYEEITSVLSPDDDVTTHDITKMVYLDRVFKETMRFAMIVPFISRQTTGPVELSQCTLPPGSNVIISLGSLGKDPKTFPDPEKFDPDRFNSDNSLARERYAFLPFSGGPRNCIGKRYAEMLAKVMVVHVLRRYRLSTHMDIHKLTRKHNIILVSTEGYKLQVHARP